MVDRFMCDVYYDPGMVYHKEGDYVAYEDYAKILKIVHSLILEAGYISPELSGEIKKEGLL